MRDRANSSLGTAEVAAVKKIQHNASRGRTLREAEAAEMLKVSMKTLPAWRSRGQGPAYVKCGRAVRYLETDLDSYLESHRVVPGEAAKGAAGRRR
jgi:predicted DNA-binding transcriptional regulator AlpA